MNFNNKCKLKPEAPKGTRPFHFQASRRAGPDVRAYPESVQTH